MLATTRGASSGNRKRDQRNSRGTSQVTLEAWIPAISTSTLLGAFGALGAIYFKAAVEKRFQRELETKIELFKSDLRREEESIKSVLASRESELSAIRETILSEMSARRAAIESRRLEAAENIWEFTTEYNKHLLLMKFAECINMKVMIKRSKHSGPDQAKIRTFASEILKLANISDNFSPSKNAEKDRFYVSPWYGKYINYT